MIRVWRLAFFVTAVVVTLFALLPGPLGQIIESGEERHLLAFAMLPALSSLGWPRVGPVRQWLGYALFGGAIELAQEWMGLGRHAELSDWLLDLAAAAISLALAHAIRRLIRPALPA